MTAKVPQKTDGAPLLTAPRCPKCPTGAPCLFSSQNGAPQGCPTNIWEVPHPLLSRRVGHPRRTFRRTVHIHVCPTCQTAVLSGLDGDRAALPITVTAHALTATGEAWALTNGLPTYELIGRQLYPRDRWNIPGKPPSAGRTVLAAHDCDLTIPAEHRRPPAPPSAPRPTTTGIGF